MKTANAYITQAKKWYGLRRSDRSHKPIIDTYNAQTPLPRGYKVTYTDAYCQTFISAVAIASGMKDIFAMECGCPEAIAIWKKMGCWLGRTSSPKVGDIIYYDWGGDGVSDHVGVITEVTGSMLKVLEGNKNGNVDYRSVQIGQTTVCGYARPKYEAEKTEKEPTKETKKYAGDYTCTTAVNLHKTPDISSGSVTDVLPEGRKVRCYGIYKDIPGRTMLCIQDLKTGKEGWISKKILKEV